MTTADDMCVGIWALEEKVEMFKYLSIKSTHRYNSHLFMKHIFEIVIELIYNQHTE